MLAARLQADIVHLAYPVPLRPGAFYCPTVVSLHDMYPYDIPENFGFPKVLFNQLVLRQCLAGVDAIACVSHSTLSRLAHTWPELATEKAFTIWNCVDPQTEVSGPITGWNGRPFLLCVAQHRRNKNIIFALRVFARLLHTRKLVPGTSFVVVGFPGPETTAIRRFLRSVDIADRVMLLSGISDARMQWCYRHCDLLLAPSIMEGFGLPVAEALLAGCRVLCSDVPAFREVGGNRCRYIPLDSAAEQNFADAAEDAFRQERPRPTALPEFSTTNIAEQYLQLYQSLILPAATAETHLYSGSTSHGDRLA